MIRVQIQLKEEQHRRLKAWAGQRNISIAEAARLCIDDHLTRTDAPSSRSVLVRAALAVVGKYRDPRGVTNIARDHDANLAATFRH